MQHKYGFVKGTKELEFQTKSLRAEGFTGTFFGITQSKQILVLNPPRWRKVSEEEFAEAFGITLNQVELILDARGRVPLEIILTTPSEDEIEVAEGDVIGSLSEESEEWKLNAEPMVTSPKGNTGRVLVRKLTPEELASFEEELTLPKNAVPLPYKEPDVKGSEKELSLEDWIRSEVEKQVRVAKRELLEEFTKLIVKFCK